jgi:membrane fusion protein, heavy metal efflux system
LIDVGSNSVQALPIEAIIKADGREFIFVLEEHEAGEKEGKHDHKEGEKHDEKEEKSYHFQRIEVKTGNAQLGFVQATALQTIEKTLKLSSKGRIIFKVIC